MDRETLTNAIKGGPVRVTMNDGSKYEIPSLEVCLVSEISAYVLYRDENEKWRTHILSLVGMTRIEELKLANE